MIAKNVLKEIAQFNLVISVVILFTLFCLVTKTETSMVKLILSGIGLMVNIMRKKTIDKNDKVATENLNWMITAFIAAVIYYTFSLFC